MPHITIACATVWAGSRLLAAAPGQRYTLRQIDPGERQGPAGGDEVPLQKPIDYRLVALGSLLPDMVDRLIRSSVRGKAWSRDQHLLGHTLLFNAPVIFAGISLARKRRDARLFGMGAAAITHLLVDPVVRSPRTLFWPLLGFAFPESRGLNRPLTLVTQIAAAAAVLAAIITLQRRGRLNDFIARGSI